MQSAIIIIGAVLWLASNGSYAQSVQVGKYSGTLRAVNLRLMQPPQYVFPIIIEIANADNGRLKGTIHSPDDGDCGNQPQAAEGTYDGRNLTFRSVEARTVRGCDELMFQGISEGSKLVGKMPFNRYLWDITLSK
jgi:hypothetical protein